MKISKLDIGNHDDLLAIYAMEDKINDIIDFINTHIKKEPIMTEKNEKLLDSILTRGLSIIDKFLARVDTKLDDEEFMTKSEKNIEVNIDEVIITRTANKEEDIHISVKDSNWNDLPDKDKDKFKKMFDEWQWTKKDEKNT